MQKRITFDQDQQLRDYENFKKRDIKKILIQHTNICYDIINIIVNFSIPCTKLKPNINLSGINLVGYDIWSHISNIKNIRFPLNDAILQGADLRNIDLRNINLRNIDLERANLQNANLEGANLEGANLRYANLRYANLRFSNVYRADLRYADLHWTDVRGANLRFAKTNDFKFHMIYPKTLFVEK